MNDTRCRGAWDKGCTDIMYMTIEYPNYPIISLLTQPTENCVNNSKRLPVVSGPGIGWLPDNKIVVTRLRDKFLVAKLLYNSICPSIRLSVEIVDSQQLFNMNGLFFCVKIPDAVNEHI